MKTTQNAALKKLSFDTVCDQERYVSQRTQEVFEKQRESKTFVKKLNYLFCPTQEKHDHHTLSRQGRKTTTRNAQQSIRQTQYQMSPSAKFIMVKMTKSIKLALELKKNNSLTPHLTWDTYLLCRKSEGVFQISLL